MKKDIEKGKKQKKFKLFDLNRDGKGVYEVETRKPNLKFFFILLKRKFTQLLQLNLLMLLQVLPIIAIAAIIIFGAKTNNITDPSFVPLYGISKIVESPALLTQLDLVSLQMEVPLFTPAMTVGIILLILFLAVTFGWQNVGATCVLRGLFRGDAVFVFSDFFYAIKKNLKQGFFLGLIDFICSAVLIVDLSFFLATNGGIGTDIMLGIIVAMAIIYLFMRFYIYQLLITFDLKNIKILKNALIFSTLGVLRNLMALLGIALLLILHIVLIVWLLPMGISIPLVLPFIYILAIIGFMTTYAAYPIIDKYMIAPYNNEAITSDSSTEE